MRQRQAATEHTRARILAAARKLLLSKSFSEFTMEAVARKADVSRLTVYYQFESKAGLLESLYDYLAKRGEMERLADTFRRAVDPLITLQEFILVFAHFWASDREIIRRLHGLGAIDPEVGEGIRARNQRRRQGLRVIIGRYWKANSSPTSIQEPDALDTLHMLTSFETFDALAGGGRSLEEVVTIIRRQAHYAIGIIEKTSAK
jgi:AcrR family transcriptional regulator